MSKKNSWDHASRGQYKRCYESHPPLPITVGEKTYVVYGGSCAHPVVEDADIYVGFDMSHRKSDKAYPWVSGESFLYYIADMHAPSDPTSFKALIEWLSVQLIAGKKVHLGCIGGHGRTGTVLAALVKHMTGMEDAITYVRENYCQKAVEAACQVRFLNEHFGIKEVIGAKEFHGTETGRWSGAKEGWSQSDWINRDKEPPVKPLDSRPSLPKGEKDIRPTKHKMAIWGPNVTLDKLPQNGMIEL